VRRSQLYNIYLVVFIVMLGFGLIMPLLPYFVAQYGGNAFVLGLLVASYAAAQFIGAPMLGRLSDRAGRRPILLVSMAGTALGFLLLGLAEPLGRGLAALVSGGSPPEAAQNAAILGVMFLSRILSGLSGGMITVAQAYIADVTDQEHRAQALGGIGAAFGLGFILGPITGGVLSQWGFAVPAFAAAGMAALNLLTILFLLPESLSAARKAELAKQPKRALIDFAGIVKKMAAPRLGPLLIIRLFSSIAGALFMTLFTLWSKDRLGLNAQATSYLMAYLGLLSIVVQIGLIGPLTKRFSDAQLITWALPLQAVALLAWAFTPSVPVLVVVLIPLALTTGVLNTVINSAISWAVAPHEMGDALGTAGALESLSRVIAPTVGGLLLGALGAWAPGVLAAGILGSLAAFAWRRLIARPDPVLAVA
jgi:DHA1 family tetracycline resistance protein-like MFS transporter